jgi:hypothetical protein
MTSPGRLILRFAFGAWLVYLAFLAPSLASWDGGGMLNVAVSIVEHHDITVDPAFGTIGRNGKYYSMWYPLLSIIAIPFAALGIFISHDIHLPEAYVVGLAAIVLSTIIAAANAGATYWLARRLGAERHFAMLAGIVFGFGTLALRYSRSFYADPLLTFFVTLGIGLVLESECNFLLAAFCALAILSKPPGLLFGVVAFCYAAIKRNWPQTVAIGAGTTLGGLLYLVWNFARFGDVTKFGQPDFWGLSTVPGAALGLLVSPSVGLFICCPIVLLACLLWRKGMLIWIVTLALLLFYSAWGRWYASDWGPRFLMPVIPALIALSALTEHRRTWLALAMAGLLMQIPTAAGYPERYQEQLREHGIPQAGIAWKPPLSPLVEMWPVAMQQIRDAQSQSLDTFRSYRGHASTLADARNFRIVPLWWWMLPLVHIPRLLGAIVSALLAIFGIRLMLQSCSLPETERSRGRPTV